MKLRNIINPDFKVAMHALLASKLPVALSWKIKKNILKMDENIKLYDESRMELATKLADKDEKGEPKVEASEGRKMVIIAEDKRQEFLDELKSLEDVEVDLETISLQALSDAKVEIEPKYLLALGDFIQE